MQSTLSIDIPASSLDLTSNLGYGLIFRPFIAHVNPNVNPMMLRNRYQNLRKHFIRRR